MANEFLRHCLSRLLRGDDLSREDAARLLESMLESDATEGQIAATLIALSAKGEAVTELAGMASALRSHALSLSSAHECFIDTAGTGSSTAKTFNVSTAAAFVISGAGLPVAKHGNRAASSRCGSADVLTALGVNVSAAPDVSQNCLSELGICFMFAPLYHGATARVAGVRRELGVPTVFNLLGPLSNPAGAPRQVIGVWKKELVEPVARALAELGTRKAWVVHGLDGLDELTIADDTLVAEALDGSVNTFHVTPADFGLQRRSLVHLRGGGAPENAQIIRNVLAGDRTDEARSLVLINAAAALFVGGRAENLMSAMKAAEQSIDSGAAMRKLEQLITATTMTAEGRNRNSGTTGRRLT